MVLERLAYVCVSVRLNETRLLTDCCLHHDPFTHPHVPLLRRGSGLLARGMNKTKQARSIINLHTLSLPLPPSGCKENPGCGSEDGVRWMSVNSPWHEATPPLASEHHLLLERWTQTSVVYQTQGSPVPLRLCRADSPTVLNHSVKQAGSCTKQ